MAGCVGAGAHRARPGPLRRALAPRPVRVRSPAPRPRGRRRRRHRRRRRRLRCAGPRGASPRAAGGWCVRACVRVCVCVCVWLQVGDEGPRRAAGSGRRNSDAPKAVVSDEDTPPSPPTSPHSFSLLSFPSVPPSSKPESVVVGPPLLTVGPSVNAPSIPHTLRRACPPSFRSSTSVLPSLALSLALSLAPASPPQTLRPSLCPSVPFVPPFLPQSVSPAVLSFRLFVPCFVPPFR